MTDFEGDVLFLDSNDGGVLQIEDGVIACDKTFKTAVYLSLFGGNFEDDGVTNSGKAFWGNLIGEDKTKMVSKFQNTICSLPMTSKNLKTAEDAAVSDLQWLIDDGIADKVTASGKIKDLKTADFEINALKSGENILSTTFGIEWEAMANGL